jgi:hypothetical protein
MTRSNVRTGYGLTVPPCMQRPMPRLWRPVPWSAASLATLLFASACEDSQPAPGRSDLAAPNPALLELADEGALRRLADWRALPHLGSARQYEQQSSRDRGLSAEPFLPVARAGNTDFNHFVCASADAQISQLQLAPFRFDRTECPESYVRGAVLGRFEGAGAMVRMWLGMASLLFAPADDEVLRIYVDDDPEPRVETPLAAAMDGSAGELFAPPFGAGSSRRLAWYYPVAFRNKLIVSLDRLGDYDLYYYQCDVASEAHPSDAITGAPPDQLPPEEPPSEQPPPEQRLPERDLALHQLTRVAHPAGDPTATLFADHVELAVGEIREFQSRGPGTLLELQVSVPDQQYAALAAIRMQTRWDGAAEPAIDVTLRDLFGGGEVAPPGSSLALASELDVDERHLVLRLPMPFATAADFRFENEGTAPLRFELTARGEQAPPIAPFGHLHVRQREVDAPTDAPTYVAAFAEGRGRLIGACSHVQGIPDVSAGIQADPLNLLEGDVRATIDGRIALDGTGSEEYADDAFYFQDAPQATAFAQTWTVSRESKQMGKASYCRWHVLGTELDFLSSLQLDIELGGFDNPHIVVGHRTISYWYLAD